MSRALVINCGSSSLKYRLFDDERTLAKGLIERIGEPDGDAPDHEAALRQTLAQLDLGLLTVVGHRVVHGGTRFVAPVRVDDDVLAEIRDLIPLAPLHNTANVAGIEVARRLLPETPQVAVFDTGFHHTLPPAAATYAIDSAVAARYGIRRYGFHGTSHRDVARRTAELLQRPLETMNMITLHLGNGASACAIRDGLSVATSMGLTPLEGLVMGSRSGNIDAGAVFELHRNAGMSVDEIETLLNYRSGLLGMCGDNDMRLVLTRRARGDASATLAFDVYCSRITAYIGAYAFLLGRVDAITFTAGVGENSAEVRAAALSNLEDYGILIDPVLNTVPDHHARIVSPDLSSIAVCVIPTNEELEIAVQSRQLIDASRPADHDLWS